MYSHGVVLPEDEIRKQREIMERVKKDFIDNETTFLNVLNRGKYSSG
jgi:hypothetical protein